MQVYLMKCLWRGQEEDIGLCQFGIMFYFGITFPLNLCQIRYKVLMVFHSIFLVLLQ